MIGKNGLVLYWSAWMLCVLMNKNWFCTKLVNSGRNGRKQIDCKIIHNQCINGQLEGKRLAYVFQWSAWRTEREKARLSSKWEIDGCKARNKQNLWEQILVLSRRMIRTHEQDPNHAQSHKQNLMAMFPSSWEPFFRLVRVLAEARSYNVFGIFNM